MTVASTLGRATTDRSWVIAPASPGDLAAILALETTGFDHKWSAERWSVQSWADEIAHHWVRLARPVDPTADRAVGETADLASGVTAGATAPMAGVVAGVVAFHLVGDSADLTRLIVAPPYRRHGLGHRLVVHGLDWAGAAGAHQVLLEVSSANQAALGLYRQLGFTEIARRPDYYGPGDAAVVMRRDDV